MGSAAESLPRLGWRLRGKPPPAVSDGCNPGTHVPKKRSGAYTAFPRAIKAFGGEGPGVEFVGWAATRRPRGLEQDRDDDQQKDEAAEADSNVAVHVILLVCRSFGSTRTIRFRSDLRARSGGAAGLGKA